MSKRAASVASSARSAATGRGKGSNQGKGSGGGGRKSAKTDSAHAVQVATKCSLCKASPWTPAHPAGKEWAFFDKVGTDDVPIGPFCKACDEDIYQESFGSIMARQEFINELKDKKMAEDVAECQRIAGGGQKRIADQQVTSNTIRGVTLEKPHLFVNAQQYKATFRRRAPTGLTWPSVWMPKDDGSGQEERLFLFRDEPGEEIPHLGAHTKGNLWVTKTLTTETVHLPKRKHKFQRQALRVVNHHSKKMNFDLLKPGRVRTIAQERERLAQKGSAGSDHEADAEDDCLEVPPVAVSEVAEASEDAAAAQRPSASGPSSASGIKRSASSANLQAILDETQISEANTCDDASDAPNLALGRSPRAARSIAGSHITADGAATSLAGSDAEEDDDDAADENDEISSKVKRYCVACSCSKALDGVKLGNPKRRLNELLESLLEDPDNNTWAIAEIKAHKRILQIAEDSAIKLLPGLNFQQFSINMKTLKVAQVVLSPSYKSAVFTKHINALLSGVAEAESAGVLGEVLEAVKLHELTDPQFDPLNPKMGSLEWSGYTKFKMFQKLVMERVFLPLLSKGNAQASTAKDLSQRLLDSFENMSEDIELNDQSSAVVMDLMTIWRCIVGVSSDLGDVGEGDLEVYDEAVATMMGQSKVVNSRNVKAMVGKVLMANVEWLEKLQNFVSTRAAFKDMGPKIQTTMQSLNGTKLGDDSCNEILVRASEVHLLAAEKLPSSTYTALTKCLLSKTTGHVTAVMMLDKAGKMSKLQAASKALQSVSLALSHESLINDCIAEIAQAMRETDEDSKTTIFQQTATSIMNQDAKTIDAASGDICKSLEYCQGLSSNETKNAPDCYKTMAKLMIETFSIEDLTQGGEGARVVAEALTTFMPDDLLAKTCLDCFSQVRNMYVLLTEKKAKDDQGAYSFAVNNVDSASFKTFQGYLAKATGLLESVEKGIPEPGDHSATELIQLCTTKIAECSRIADEGKKHYHSHQKDSLQKSIDSLSPRAGGAAGGADWFDNLPENCGWEDFEDECKKTLLQDEFLGSQLSTLRKQLLQDRAYMALYTVYDL